MSLKKFSDLFDDLDSINSTNNKIEVLKSYFLSNEPIDNSWAIYLLTGKSNKRFVSGRYLRDLFSEVYDYPEWLIDTCYLKVGDSAEVISLLLKNKNYSRNKKKIDELKGNLILLPPSLSKGSYLKNFKNIQTAFASGWMSIRALRKRSGYDKGFAISDHADWEGILEVVKKSEAKNVFFHHGDSEALSKYLSGMNQKK